MTESIVQPSFGLSDMERSAAYHCFGDKVSEILSSIEQPYKDIANWSIDEDLHSKVCIALFVFTDHAEVYASEIDNLIKQYKNAVKEIFILDLHASRQSKALKERWGFYNILTSRYYSAKDNIQNFLLLFKHFIETQGLISMDFFDFKYCMREATFITAGTASSLKEPIDPIPYSKDIRTLMMGLELERQEQDKAKEDMDVLASFFDQLPDSVEVKWQISRDFGNPHVEYIVGFDSYPAYDTAHS